MSDYFYSLQWLVHDAWINYNPAIDFDYAGIVLDLRDEENQ